MPLAGPGGPLCGHGAPRGLRVMASDPVPLAGSGDPLAVALALRGAWPSGPAILCHWYAMPVGNVDINRCEPGYRITNSLEIVELCAIFSITSRVGIEVQRDLVSRSSRARSAADHVCVMHAGKTKCRHVYSFVLKTKSRDTVLAAVAAMSLMSRGAAAASPD